MGLYSTLDASLSSFVHFREACITVMTCNEHNLTTFARFAWGYLKDTRNHANGRIILDWILTVGKINHKILRFATQPKTHW
jgi:hypothetical protein